MRTLILSLTALLGLSMSGCGYTLGVPVPTGDDDSACPEDTGETGDDDTAVESDDYNIVFTVTSSGVPFLDFSYGYCSDVEDSASCADWHQSVVDDTAGPSVVSPEILVLDTGSGRLNSTYTNDSGAEIGWLCQLGTDAETGDIIPQLTGSVDVAVNGLDLGDGFVTGVLYGNGCSGGYSVTEIINAYLVATGG